MTFEDLATRSFTILHMPSTAITPQKLPLYIQISELLTREIGAGRWHAGERLPAESDLAKRLKVAVGTLRKSLAELEARGLLERRQGSGTYVRSKSARSGHSDTVQAKSIYEFFRLELLNGGGLPSALLLDLQCIPRPSQVPAFGQTTGMLNNSKKTDAPYCYRLRRLRLLNNTPIALEEIYFDKRHAQNLQLADLSEALYLFYQERLGFWISSVEDRIGMGEVPAWSAELAPKLFSLGAGSPCPVVERWSMSGASQIEEHSVTWFDPLRARYVNRIR